MSKHIGAALTAANITYDIADFRNPQLDRLTPIQVTKDGRVYGHLAGWKTDHIGRPGTKPPHGTDYKYFHQGLAPTTEGDLPVGHLTLGTGHAGAGNAVQAAAHYDNTGAQVAQVRAGEDAHGIWIAGRMLPTADDLQRQTLRRSSLSGDWRKVDGAWELVAALAVNVPGFPIPRTETLVASGADDALVAAGIVRNGPITYDEVAAMVAAAGTNAQQLVDRAIRAERLRHRAAPVLDEIIVSGRVAQRQHLTARAQQARRQQVADRYASILAAGVDTSGRMPAGLHRYWTSGTGLARWASTPTPYRSLVKALQQEIAGMSPAHIKGLAANLYHDVFHKWPGSQSRAGGALTAAAAPMPAAEAAAWLDDPEVQAALAEVPAPGTAPVGEPVDLTEPPAEPRTDGMIALIPTAGVEPVEGGETELHLTLVYLPDAAALGDLERQSILSTVSRMCEAREPVTGDLFARAEFNADDSDKEQCAVWLVNGPQLGQLHDDVRAALGDRVPPSEYGAFVPHITAGYNMAADRLPVGAAVTFDAVRVAFGDEFVDVPLGPPAQLLGEVEVSGGPGGGEGVELDTDPDALYAAAGDRKVKTQAGAEKYGVSIGDVIGKGVDDAIGNANGAVDRAQQDASNLGRSVAEALFGKPADDKPAPKPAPAAPAPPKPAGDAAPKAAPAVAEAKVIEAPATVLPSQKKPTRPKARPKAAPAKRDERTEPRTSTPADTQPARRNDADEPQTSTPADSLPAEPPAPVDATVESDVQPRLDVGAGTDHPMEEDESPMTGAEGGELVSYGDGVAVYSDGTQTDGTTWTRSPVLPGMEYDGQTLLEDQAPYKGANGGDLVDFDGSRGVAVYSDGTETDGKEWRKVDEQTAPVVSSAWSRIIAAGSAR